MNSYQDALTKLVKHIDFPKSPQRAFDSKKDEPRKYYILLQHLVDKEKSKKVLNFKCNSYFDELENPIYTIRANCPCCNNLLNKKQSYCDDCGQALDWSEEDDQ